MRPRPPFVLLACIFALSACSAQTDAVQEAYKSVLDGLVRDAQGLEPASSLLEDRKITEEELKELDAAFISCMDNLGFPGSSVTLAGEGEVPIPTDGRDSGQAYQDCQKATMASIIHSTFWDMRTNPENLSQDEAIFRCLKRFDMLDPNLSLDEFSREEDEWMKTAPRREDGVILGGPSMAHTYADPVKGEKLFNDCMSDPSISPPQTPAS